MGAATSRQNHISIVNTSKRESRTFCESSENTLESDLLCEGIKFDHILPGPMGAVKTRQSQIKHRPGIKQDNLHSVGADKESHQHCAGH